MSAFSLSSCKWTFLSDVIKVFIVETEESLIIMRLSISGCETGSEVKEKERRLSRQTDAFPHQIQSG